MPIELDADVKDKIEAIRYAGKLLMDNGFVEEEYIDGMIDIFNEFGPYIVISEGIAMPHSRPETGALRSGFCVVRLKKPIEFGNEENDPVKLIVGLSAKDDESHLEVIQFISLLLDSEVNQSILFEGSLDEIKQLIWSIYEKSINSL